MNRDSLSYAADLPAVPGPARQRIAAIDLLRGIAMLGILLMNIQSFAMPVTAYSYPWSWGDMTGINAITHYVTHVIASGKFISIFSMLFGAGILLQLSRFEDPRDATRIHFRRMLGLLAFGLIHAYALWYGDILFSYALLGMLVFVFRNRTIGQLLWIALAFFAAGLVMNLLIGALAYVADAHLGQDLDSAFNPSHAAQMKEVTAYRGSWLEQMPTRALTSITVQTYILMIYSLPFVTAFMLLGMALMKSGFYAGAWPRKRYVMIAILGIEIGWCISAAGLMIDAKTGRQPTLSATLLTHLNTLAMAPTAVGYSAAVILIAGSPLARWLAPLVAVGKTALSCYLLETLLCTTIFYGHGFGYFGRLERGELLLVVLGVWIVVMMLAWTWTHFFRYGPAEWLWRAITYGTARL